MKGLWYVWTRVGVLLLFALCFTLAACGGSAADMAPAEEAASEEEPLEEATEIAAGIGDQPTAVPTIEPTPDFGSIAYDVPNNMVREEAVQVILLVSPSEEDLTTALEEELAEVGQDPDNVQTATVEVAKRMSASLTSAPAGAFEIVPLQAADEQLLLDDEPTQWEWTVVPLLGGTHRLILRIDRLVERDGIVEPFKEEVHRDDVTVEVPMGLRVQDAWGGFDIKWLVGVFIFPLFFYILSRRDKKNDQGS
jgi:hypothetical protein